MKGQHQRNYSILWDYFFIIPQLIILFFKSFKIGIFNIRQIFYLLPQKFPLTQLIFFQAYYSSHNGLNVMLSILQILKVNFNIFRIIYFSRQTFMVRNIDKYFLVQYLIKQIFSSPSNNLRIIKHGILTNISASLHSILS